MEDGHLTALSTSRSGKPAFVVAPSSGFPLVTDQVFVLMFAAAAAIATAAAAAVTGIAAASPPASSWFAASAEVLPTTACSTGPSPRLALPRLEVLRWRSALALLLPPRLAEA